MRKRIARPFAVLVLVMAMLGLGVEPAAAAVPSAPVFFDAFGAVPGIRRWPPRSPSPLSR